MKLPKRVGLCSFTGAVEIRSWTRLRPCLPVGALDFCTDRVRLWYL